MIDTEVARLLREAEQHAIDLLTTHRRALDDLTSTLLAQETVDGKTVNQIAGVAIDVSDSPNRDPVVEGGRHV